MKTYKKSKSSNFLVVCLYCKKHKVPVSKWNRKCDFCKKGGVEETQIDLRKVGRRKPVAVIEDESGKKIFVDKNGMNVYDHDYDLDKDPRGWKTTGAEKPKRSYL